MSNIAFSYVFGSSLTHSIQCVAHADSIICTGSKTGEIAIWKGKPNWEVGVICSVPEDSSCISICIVPCHSNLATLLLTDFLIVSLHSNSKIRTWDATDGKCIAYSFDLFSEQESALKFLIPTPDSNAILSGKNEIFLIDISKMQKIRYFFTDKDVLGLKVFQSQIFAADCEKLYLFRLNSEENDPKIIQKYQSGSEKKILGYDGDLFVMTCHDGFEFFQLEGDAVCDLHENIRVAEVPGKISFLSIFNGDVLVGAGEIIFVYAKIELLKACMNSEYTANAIQHILNIVPQVYLTTSDCVLLTDLRNLFFYSFSTKKTQAFRFFLPEHNFSILNPGETIISRNIFIYSEILIAIGTNAGRVIVQSLSDHMRLVYFYKKTEITAIFLYKSLLIIGHSNDTLTFWPLKLQKGTSYHTLPDKIIEVWASSVKVMIPISYSKRNIDFFNEMSWKSSKALWAEIILGQCATGAILLINAEQQEILCYFQALKSDITKAVMYLNLEYLAVSCANGNLYVFNMTMQAIERVITGDAVIRFDSHVMNEIKPLEKSHFSTACLAMYFENPPKKALEVKMLSVGKRYFPTLHVNITKLVKFRHRYPVMVTENLCEIIKKNEFKQGIYGMNQALSFICNWVDSKYANSLRVSGLISLGVQPINLPIHPISMIVYSLNPHSLVRGKLLEYIDLSPDLVKLTESMIGKNKIKRKGRRSMTNTPCTNFNIEKYHCQRVYISLLDAISMIIIICASIKDNRVNDKLLIEYIIKMLRSGEPGYVLLACELIHKGKDLLKSLLHECHVEEIIKELLLYSCKGFGEVSKNFFYKTIIEISLNFLDCFIKTLSNEIKNSDLDSNYPHSIIFTIEYFVLHNYLEVTSIIENLCNFMLVAYDLKNSISSNKEVSGDFISVLQTFSSLLPMVSVTYDLRFLVAGLPTGLIVLYDFRAGKKWKSLKVFNTSVSIVEIRENIIACYSSIEGQVKTLKIDQGLFGGIIGQGELKLLEKIQLNAVDPLEGSYQELLKTLRIRWSGSRCFTLTRENREETIINLSKI